MRRLAIPLLTVLLMMAARNMSAQTAGPAPAANTMRPALIGKSPGALVNRIDTRTLLAAGQKNGEVMFCAVVDGDGKVKAPFTYHATADGKVLEEEVKRALSDTKMIPAVRNGEPVAVFYYGTVTFQVVDNKPRLRIFANQEAKELKAENDFIGPQPCVGGDSKFTGPRYPTEAMAVPVTGEVELALKIDAAGNLIDEHVVTESPPLLGFGEAALEGFRGAKFIPAYRNGQPVACEVTLPIIFEPQS